MAVTSQDLLKNPGILLTLKGNPSTPLKSFEGRVGAVALNGEYFITSPNVDVVYTPPSSSRMSFKRDYRLGINDFLLWPQPFIDEHCHLAAIPRAPDVLDPTKVTHILFSNPADDEHFKPHYGGTLAGLGNISTGTLQQLKRVRDNCQSKADKYWADSSFPHKTPIFTNTLGVVKLYLEILECMPMTRRQLGFAFAELQRFMLEFIGAYQYIHLYKPRIDNLVEPSSKTALTVGAFVTSLTDCKALFCAGIPVWLVRPARLARSVHVDSLVQLVDPKDLLCLDEASPKFHVFFNGSPTNPRKYKVFSQFSRHFFSFGDPFNTGHPSESSALTSSMDCPLPSSNIGQPDLTSRSKDNRRPAPYRKPAAVASSGRNKFAEPESSLMPPAILAWCSALAHVVTDQEGVVFETGYAFPEPGLFVGVTTEERQALYFANWLKYRDALIYRLAFSSSASTTSNKLWRMLLTLPLNHNPVAPPKRDNSEKTSRSQKQHDVVYTLLESCFNMDEGVSLNSGALLLDISWQGQTLSSTSVPPVQIAQEILWELYELNFRFEFMALDHQAHVPPEGSDGPPREPLVLACFGGMSLAVTPIHSAHEGLGAINWRARQSSIIAMRTVMETWRGFMGAKFHIMKGADDLSKEEFLDVEWAVAHFYTQCFFKHFAHAAIVPHTLPST